MTDSDRGAPDGNAAEPPVRLLLGSIHCHSTGSDGTADPGEIMAIAGAVGLDFLAITDHVPAVMADHPPKRPAGDRSHGAAVFFPAQSAGVLRLPGLEFSPPHNHYLVLGLDPADVPDPTGLPGWPRPEAYMAFARRWPGTLGFLAHPDDPGNGFLHLQSYRWDDWAVTDFTGLEVWSLSSDWSRSVRNYREAVRAVAVGVHRAVPPPNPVTVARWDALAQERKVVGIAGTDAHAYRARWHGVRVTVFPYEPAFGTLQTAVWARFPLDGSPEAKVSAILEALGQGRAFMVNRVWGHPSGFVFRAGQAGPGGSAGVFSSGDTLPAGFPARFEVAVPIPCWLRLVRNGVAVANTYGRELSFEPLEQATAAGPGAPPGPENGAVGRRQEAWRAEAWVNEPHWSKVGSGFFPWIFSNFIYRELPL